MLPLLLLLLLTTTPSAHSAPSTGSYVYTDGQVFPLTAADFTNVPETHVPLDLPAGCKCVETVSAGCKFDCTCTCNLTPNQCDANCCCDSDCTEAEVTLFKSSHSYCKDTTTTILSVSKCMSTNTVVDVNPSYGLREYSPADGMDGFLCVTKDNNPTKGNFYSAVTTPQSETVLDSSNVKRTYSFIKTRVSADAYDQVGFVAGNRIQAAFPNADVAKTGYAAFGGYMALPTAGLDGKCNTQNPLRFASPVTTNVCMQVSPRGDDAAMAGYCTSQFGFASLVGKGASLYLAKKFSNTLSVGVAGNTDLYVPVKVGTITLKVLATGESSAGHSIGTDANSKWDAVKKTCVNALVGIHYRVTYVQPSGEEGGTIESITANLIVGDLKTSGGTGTGQYLNLQQEYLVDFVESGVVQPRARSGNPGYNSGLPVLAGRVVGNGATGVETVKNAIEQVRDGLRIPFYSDERGDCKPDLGGSELDEINPAGEQVLFRHEFVQACTLSWTKAELKAACEQDPDTVTKSSTSTYGVYLNSTGIPNRIGVYGNANYTNTDLSEWLAIKINKPVGQGTWSDSLMECNTLVTSMNVEFLYANAGAYLNPQPKIVAARVSFGREDFKFINNNNPTDTATKKTNVILTTSVTFVHLANEALEEYVPPAPPLLPEIPYDIFYPFLLSEGGRSSNVFWSGFPLLVCTLMLALR